MSPSTFEKTNYKSMKTVFIIILATITYTLPAQKNLVIEGGSVRGIAYVGALEELENNGVMENIENVSGTSVGAIAASLIATGYDAQEMKEITSHLNIKKFNDGRGIFVGGSYRMAKKYGWYRGDKLEKWLNELYFEKTGISNITLQQLYDLSKEKEEVKALYVTATNLTTQTWMPISHREYPNMQVSTAVRISASVPMYFTAIFMNDEGEIFRKNKKNENLMVLVDGGILANYPISIFDDQYPKNQTLGLRLEREEQLVNDTSHVRVLAPYEINNIQNYVGAFYNIVIENLNRNQLTEEDWARTISISTSGIGNRIRKLKPDEIDGLIEGGRTATRNYYESLSRQDASNSFNSRQNGK